MSVEVQYAVPPEDLPPPEAFAGWVRAALQGQEGQLTVRLVDEEEMRSLNETYRGKEGPTNVLAFPFEPPPGVEMDYLGDIVLCVPRIKAEARAGHKPLEAHLAHLTLHGTLHLLGLDHKTPGEARVMEALESRLMTSLGYGDPYR